MNKKLSLAACIIALACACQPRASQNGNDQNDDRNYHDRRAQKTQGNGCCETPKPQAPQQTQTVATPEVKVEKTQ